MSVCVFLSVSVSSPLFPSPNLSSSHPFPLPLFPILILHIICGMIELSQELFSSGIVKLGQITLLINLKKECLCGQTHRGACPENSENNGLLVMTTEHLKICAPFLGSINSRLCFLCKHWKLMSWEWGLVGIQWGVQHFCLWVRRTEHISWSHKSNFQN